MKNYDILAREFEVKLKQAVMRGPTRVKRKESEKHPFQVQNDIILTIFGKKLANLSIAKTPNISTSTILTIF